MREIIFRGKRVDTGDWCYGVPFVEGQSKTTYIASYEYSSLAFIQPIEVVPETLCEFTGLYDKNGNQIWENDIVKTKFGRLCKVVWRQTQCFVGWDFNVCDFDFDVNDFSKPLSSWDLYSPENLEVIGNSIDNPELLTAERSDNENQ